jgi:hypothetical protein
MKVRVLSPFDQTLTDSRKVRIKSQFGEHRRTLDFGHERFGKSPIGTFQENKGSVCTFQSIIPPTKSIQTDRTLFTNAVTFFHALISRN